MKRYSHVLFVLVSIFAVLTIGYTISVSAQDDPSHNLETYQNPNFEDITIALTRFDELEIMTGDYEQGVTFNDDLAREFGFSEQEITLGLQIVDATNNLIEQAKNLQAKKEADEMVFFSLDLQQYPELERYLADASQFAGEIGLDNSAVKNTEGDELQRGMENSLNMPERVRLPARYRVCGYFGHPVPSYAAPWHTYHASNPASKLRSRGFHPTPRWAGNGWTRPQTYKWWLCGWGTYRDHARILNASTYRIQNYTGRVPGEPNPEFWRSGPWPYPAWPLYVRWWHRQF